jgi:hypothetical protein
MEMRLKAKFRIDGVASQGGADQESREILSASAVTSESPENATWSRYTPSGQLTMTITNPAAFGAFAPGQEVYIEIYSDKVGA